MNGRIRSRNVQLVNADNENVGVVPIQEALKIAREAELDLVEVAPNAKPPVCRIMDYGKFAYEKARKERDARKKQKKVEIKSIRLRPKVSDFHRDIKVKNARRWLMEGKKVKVAVRFQGREIQYTEIGRELILGVVEELSEISTVETRPNMEGWQMIAMLAPEEKAIEELKKARAKAEEDSSEEVEEIEEIVDSS
ncbi:MAG: translation initiation factor IF-3 [Chloroflexota bacterium]